jgi:PTH1 family peptidyl-tRNA hydrolase
MKLLVGLGNPGSQYASTRHNIGFMVLNKLADNSGVVWKKGYKGEYADISVGGSKCCLLKPMTYMNLSGESVEEFYRFFKIVPEDVLVIHDELDFPFSKLRLKRGGSAGGHNGVESVIKHLNTDGFNRLRMGICGMSRAELRDHQRNYVLAPFTAEERKTLDEFVAYGAEAAECYAINGLVKTMNLYNLDCSQNASGAKLSTEESNV